MLTEPERPYTSTAPEHSYRMAPDREDDTDRAFIDAEYLPICWPRHPGCLSQSSYILDVCRGSYHNTPAEVRREAALKHLQRSQPRQCGKTAPWRMETLWMAAVPNYEVSVNEVPTNE